jgi:hypothetical protein
MERSRVSLNNNSKRLPGAGSGAQSGKNAAGIVLT